MSSTGFNWRDGGGSPVRTALSNDQREGYRLVKIWIPDEVNNLILGPDQWEPVRGVRFNGEDKAFLHGFTSVLGLTSKQERQLLIMYAEQYQQALTRSGDHPYKHGKANRAANQWIRHGARGFLIRE